MAEIVKIDPMHPDRAFSRAREVIRAGGVIAYPTETFYGLGVDPRNPDAVRKIFGIKGRKADQPLLLLISGPEKVEEWASRVTPAAGRLMAQFWPGPLTLVFRAKEDVLPELTAKSGTIGLRVPGSELTRRLLGFLGTALTGTSANLAGGPSPRTAGEVEKELGGAVELILDAGPAPGGEPSTVADVTRDAPRVIRQGMIRID